MAVYSKSLNVFTSETIKNSIAIGLSNVYLTFGRAIAWSNESAPDTANTSQSYKYEVWNNIIGAKKVSGSDVRNAIKRVDWATDIVYNAYDDLTIDSTLQDPNNKMYVVHNNNIYKCLANNYGANSTVAPTSTITTTDFQTADGYIWKYMYTLSSEELLRFVSTDYIPVKTLELNDGSAQWQVQENAQGGAIHNIIVINSGSEYIANDAYVVITGDGTGANAFPVRNVTTNTISSIVVDSKGSGYSNATVTIISANGSGATARAIIAPPGGHGYDPLYELGGNYLIFNLTLANEESGKLSVQNDYRQISLIKSPRVWSSNTSASNSVVSQAYKLTLTGTSNEYQEDEYVYQGATLETASFKGIVLEWDSGNNSIYVINAKGTPTSDILYGRTTGAGRFVSSITTPELQPATGRILFIDNFIAIERAINQNETFNIVLKF